MNVGAAHTASERGKSRISAMKDTSVLVVGDIMLDRFVYGSVDRISPESPVPVLSIKREDNMLGGAGNALANLAGLGVQGVILSLIGDDEEGRAVTAKAQALGLDISGLITDMARPTIVKTRFLAGHQQLLRSDFERSEPLSRAIQARLLERAEDLVPKVQSVILSDYGKGLLSDALIQTIIKTANAHNIPVIVDPKGQDFKKYKGATAVTPNKKELSEATRGMPVATDEDVITAANTIIKECGIESVVATRSADGMSVISRNAEPIHYQSAQIEVYDVSGAGDTVIATIAAAMGAGADLPEAVNLANMAGSIVVTKVGTAPIRAEELKAGLDGDQSQSRVARVCSWDEAAEHIKRWKAKGFKTGFTNGCFDIVHLGHVSYLNDARDKCDRLVVGLNSDSSVRVLKGPTRPVHDEESRAAVLAALGAVDMVVLFGAKEEGEDNTACDLLSQIQPDIYFKGGDYTVDQIPEAPSVQAYGGEVEVMPIYEGHSTTASIKKANNEEAA